MEQKETVMKDTINHTTTTRFRFWNRILILFGGKLIVHSTIKVDKDVNVLGSSATDHIQFKNTDGGLL